jgi:putative endonuclease
MFYFTYVLQSTVDKNFYAGFTCNLKLRFEQHQRGFVKATKNRKPFELIYYEACLDKNDAITLAIIKVTSGYKFQTAAYRTDVS